MSLLFYKMWSNELQKPVSSYKSGYILLYKITTHSSENQKFSQQLLKDV